MIDMKESNKKDDGIFKFDIISRNFMNMNL